MWLWDEIEQERNEIIADLKEGGRKRQEEFRWTFVPSFFCCTRQEQECRWLTVTSHPQRDGIKPLFFVGRTAKCLLGRSDIYTGV